MVRGDRKSAKDIRVDIADAEGMSPLRLITDLWERVDELEAEIAELERQIANKNLN